MEGPAGMWQSSHPARRERAAPRWMATQRNKLVARHLKRWRWQVVEEVLGRGTRKRG